MPITSDPVSYVPEAGRDFTTLTTWAGDADFPVTPVADAYIEHPDDLTVSSDGTISGDPDTYLIRLVMPDGMTYGINYEIAAAEPEPIPEGMVDFVSNCQYQGDWEEGEPRVTLSPSELEAGDTAPPWFIYDDGKAVFSGERTESTDQYQFRSELRHQSEFPYSAHRSMRQKVTLSNSTLNEYTWGQLHRNHTSSVPPPLRLTWYKNRDTLEDHLWVTVRRDSGTYERTPLIPRPSGEIDVELVWNNGTVTILIDDEVEFSEEFADWSEYENFYFKAGVYLTGSAAAEGEATVSISELEYTAYQAAVISTVKSLVPPEGFALVTLEEGLETVLMQGQPVSADVGWQVVYSTAHNTVINSLFQVDSDLPDGEAIYICLVDLDGNWMATTIRDPLVIDPEPDPGQKPAGTINFTIPTVTSSSISQPFGYSGSDADSFEARVNGGDPVAATSPIVLINLNSSTAHAIEARAINEHGPGQWFLTNVTTLAAPPISGPRPRPRVDDTQINFTDPPGRVVYDGGINSMLTSILSGKRRR